MIEIERLTYEQYSSIQHLRKFFLSAKIIKHTIRSFDRKKTSQKEKGKRLAKEVVLKYTICGGLKAN